VAPAWSRRPCPKVSSRLSLASTLGKIGTKEQMKNRLSYVEVKCVHLLSVLAHKSFVNFLKIMTEDFHQKLS